MIPIAEYKNRKISYDTVKKQFQIEGQTDLFLTQEQAEHDIDRDLKPKPLDVPIVCIMCGEIVKGHVTSLEEKSGACYYSYENGHRGKHYWELSQNRVYLYKDTPANILTMKQIIDVEQQASVLKQALEVLTAEDMLKKGASNADDTDKT